MDLKERLKRGLLHTRGFTDKLLSEITAAEDWVRRPAAGANHAMWIAGHLGHATNGFIGLVDPKWRADREEFATMFGQGTEPIDNLSAYPTPSEVSSFLTERGNVFVRLLDDCSEADLSQPVTDGPTFMYDVGAVFQMAVWHEAMHSGQLTVIHRMIGKAPLAGR